MAFGRMALVAQKFTQTVASSVFSADFTDAALGFHEGATGEIEIFAIVCTIFFLNRVGTALTALMGHGDVKLDAVSAATQVGLAFLARIAPARRRAQGPLPSAPETMSRHVVNLTAQVIRSKYRD